MSPEAVAIACLFAFIWLVGFAGSAHWLAHGQFGARFAWSSYVIAALWPLWFVPVLIWAAGRES